MRTASHQKYSRTARLIRLSQFLFLVSLVAFALVQARTTPAFEVLFSAQKVISTSSDVVLTAFAADVEGGGDSAQPSASPGDNKVALYATNGALPPASTGTRPLPS